MSEKEHKNCWNCQLAGTRAQVVLPDGPATAIRGIFAVGEAPGADEDASGIGFYGAAGKTLDKLFAEHGVSRDMYGRANICCCRPPNNQKPKKDEVAACTPWLREALTERFNVEVVLAVGLTPSCFFYNAKSLSEALARAVENNYVPDLDWAREAGIRVVPSPHTSPLAFNRNAPTGEKWSVVARRQISTVMKLIDNL